MCRLFAYAHGGFALPMSEALGASITDEFRLLARVHRDGWGSATAGPDGRSYYLSNRSADDDASVFAAVASRPVHSLIVHERLASPGIGLDFENQQPFMIGALAFGHNGTIGDKAGNVVDKPREYREALGLAGSTTRSDSRLYGELFAHLLERERAGSAAFSPTAEELLRALSATIRRLRLDYPQASYNNVIQTSDYTIMTRAHADLPICSPLLRRIYEEAGWSHRIDNYFEILYSSFDRSDGSRTSVATSSGYAASDGWKSLANNSALFISHADASLRTAPLDI